MSKIGKLAIILNSEVAANIEGEVLKVSGPKGSLQREIPRGVEVKIEDQRIKVLAKDETNSSRALQGTMRSLIKNMVEGVTKGWQKTLELVGTGYRAEVTGETLILSVGYSHPVKVVAPKGISFKVEKSDITVEGVDKELVGQVAALIRRVREPEPYKGKGIKYKDEVVRRKAGKAAKAQASA